MKSFECCDNCNQWTGGNKFCSDACRLEYHVMNKRLTGAALNVLTLLSGRGEWVRLHRNITIDSLAITRIAPLIELRNKTRDIADVRILPNGERWLKYHKDTQESAA